MLRKTLVALTAIAALGLGSAAMAAHGGGGGGGHGGGGGGGGGFAGAAHGFGAGGGGFAGGGWHGGSAGPMMMRGGSVGPVTRGGPMTTAPMAGGRTQGWNGRSFSRNNFAFDRNHDRFHHRFRNNRFFAFGFGGPIYDYAYDSCWAQVPTYYGWQWVNVCGDYAY
jgi:hypothetical protein